ncbi:DUF6884 domain-containing protein [Burkholderia gladioli]|uniref:DUF6884 domain-containing protein n=1 Tax=Burkholderia gladioli TaxID=28095 RepID=UPI001FC7E71A|nr:DUF6884 domain-containing protein [Burkholderia gladioli]MDN7742095.1 hypothetical protein [Burkholderia gladioli]
MTLYNQTAERLVVLACSATKLAHAAPAIELYRGVMYSTYRANVQAETAPAVMILSARHGFIRPDTVIEPYEQRMTEARVEALLEEIASALPAAWPAGARTILLAGGKNYRRVMRAARERQAECGIGPAGARVAETSGSLGYQRQQLSAFLQGA